MPFCFSQSSVNVAVPTTQKVEMRTPITPVVGQSFSEFVKEQASKYQHEERFMKALVRYDDLMDHIQKMEHGKYGHKLPERRAETVDGECAICLEDLGPVSDVTNTKCQHKFHTFCLVETLGNGCCTCCPLCRTEVLRLVPSGLDGASLKLVAKIILNVDAADSCHRVMFDEIKRKAAGCLLEAEPSWSSKFLPVSSKQKKLLARVNDLKNQVDLLEEFGKLNSQGFSNICGKIDRDISSGLAETLQRKYIHDRRYHRDTAQDGNGMTAALRAEIDRALGMLGVKTEESSSGAAMFNRNEDTRASETLGSITQTGENED